jgi:hypothetical protein
LAAGNIFVLVPNRMFLAASHRLSEARFYYITGDYDPRTRRMRENSFLLQQIQPSSFPCPAEDGGYEGGSSSNECAREEEEKDVEEEDAKLNHREESGARRVAAMHDLICFRRYLQGMTRHHLLHSRCACIILSTLQVVLDEAVYNCLFASLFLWSVLWVCFCGLHASCPNCPLFTLQVVVYSHSPL